MIRAAGGIRSRASRLAEGALYLRDMSEVLILNRLLGGSVSRSAARDVAATVRKARFHAHAAIPEVELEAVVRALDPGTESPVVLPPPMSFCGVGNVEYYHALGAVVQAGKPRRALEFGTYLGVGTLTIALNAPTGCHIVTIDLPDLKAELNDLNRTDLALVAESRYRVGEAFIGSSFRDQVEQVRADSLGWRGDESLGLFDLVLIDGGHSSSIIRADTENAFRLLDPNGIVLWDDYFYLYPEVVSYLDGAAREGRRLVSIRGTNLVVYSERLNTLKH